MADLIEIMARAMQDRNTSDYEYSDPEFLASELSACEDDARAAVSALEAAGFRIVSPETVTLSMTARAVECRDIEHGNMGEILAAALRAAPLHGKG